MADFLAIQYCGERLSGRLDSAVAQTRREISKTPMECDKVEQLLGYIADDAGHAQKIAKSDAARRWADWRLEASAQGARALREVTGVKAMPVPAVSKGRVASCGPVQIAQGEVGAYEHSWKVTNKAPNPMRGCLTEAHVRAWRHVIYEQWAPLHRATTSALAMSSSWATSDWKW